MNLSGTANAFKLLARPQLCIPQIKVSTFDKIPIPITSNFFPEIKSVVLDKDNCFAVKRGISVFEPYREHLERLKEAYPGPRILIVSNRAGTDRHLEEADLVELATGISVFRHSTKKPGCGPEILAYFQSIPEIGITSPNQVAVIGDRLLTDVMLANLTGSLAVWVEDGIEIQTGLLSRWEKSLPGVLTKMGFNAPKP